ncbi:hypothetical protein EOI86_08495 [Hwanghaeella grinnelliae]|uniref:DUF4136 domain-containing protein n=1 Tax=Hwanghaeella grinnelliae TaxID=2500179 RepID=A0A3S2VS63_9PROT|nr:hypothetical protein [Hwanghaeella grinnelliae]RVU39266.1 hypothetical protein EOI86_08495 [Hwanghaeella grinnelliae]
MKSSLLGLAAASALLAGCATGDSVVVQNRYQAADYNYAVVQYYNAGKPSYVEVHNNPFDNAQADDRIAALMRGKNLGKPILFTANRNYAGGDTKVVVVFNPPSSLTGLAACNLDGGQAGNGNAGDHGYVLMSYCVNGQDKSSLRASAGSVNGLDDPALERLLARATYDLLPENFSKRQGSGSS